MKQNSITSSQRESNKPSKRVMSDMDYHQSSDSDVMNQDEQLSQYIDFRDCKLTSKHTTIQSNNYDSNSKLYILEEQLKKKTMELTCYKTKFCQSIQSYQTKIKQQNDLIIASILNMNEILRVLNLKYAQLSQFQQNEQFQDSALDYQRISQYLAQSFPILQEKLQSYRPQQMQELYKIKKTQSQVIQDLTNSLNKKDEHINQFSQKYAKKIKQLKLERETFKQELNQKKNILQQAAKMQLQMDLKLINRNQLTNIINGLLKRIIAHQKTCLTAHKLSLQQISNLAGKNSLGTKNKSSSDKKLTRLRLRNQSKNSSTRNNSQKQKKPLLSPLNLKKRKH